MLQRRWFTGAAHINFLLDKELYEYFSECGEETLLTFLDKDKTLLEVLLEKNVLAIKIRDRII